MGTVTGIEEARGQVTVWVDDAPAVKVRKAHFDLCPVQEGEGIDVDAYLGRLSSVQFADAYEAALTSLDRSARSEREIAAVLRRKGYVTPAVEAVVARLKENRFIDDARYAERMAELNSRRPMGVYAFKRKLRAKGISDDDAEEALSAFDDDQQRAACLDAARSLWRRYESLPPREAKGKLSQALARRGFGWDAIQGAMDDLFD